MERFYFLVEDVDAASKAVGVLQHHGVEQDQIYLLAQNEAIAKQLDVEQASLDETRDFLTAVERGALGGAATGVLAGLAAAALTPVVVGGGLLLVAAGLGGSVGALGASLIGISERNPIFEQYKSRLEDGAILMAYDVRVDAEDEVTAALRTTLPGVEIKHRGLIGVEDARDA